MNVIGKLRGWFREPHQPLADNKLDWPGIILVTVALAVFSVGIIVFLMETNLSFWYSRPEVTPLYLFRTCPQRLFIFTPLAAFYAVTRRKFCRTNAGCLKCYTLILVLLLLSGLGAYWEILACNDEWGTYWFFGSDC